MDSNKYILLVLGLISAILSFPKIKKVSGILILVTILVGFCVTKNWLISVCVALILGNIYVSLNNVMDKPNFVEKFKNPKKKKKSVKKRKKISNEEEEEEEEEEQFKLDTKGSFLENYKALSPKQIKGLNKDTKNLIKTQKQLIETLKNMGPALKDGRQVLDTFKNYFGNEKDISGALKNFKV